MKKIYTLIAVLTLSAGAMAQNDWSVTLVSPTEGSTVDSDPLNIDFIATNESDNTYDVDEVLWFGITIEGSLYGLDLAPGGVNGYTLTAAIGPGETFTVPTVGLDWLGEDVETTFEICAVVYGIGEESFSGDGPSVEEIIVGDDDVSNNKACFSAELPVDVSVEELGLTLSNVYVSGRELMMVNEGINGESLVNMTIVNMNGQTVQAESFVMTQGTSSISLNNVTPGIYIVAIEVEGIIETKKISIQ